MRLVEQGTLDLDAPANAQLTTWKIPDTTFTAQQPVLLRHLLSHTAGATNGAVGIYPPGTPVPTLLEVLDGRAPSNRPPVRIDFVPGTRWRYAGGGYSIVQQMLMDATGQPFDVLMSRLVLAPLGMTESCFCQPLPPTLSDQSAIGHDGAGKPIAGNWWTLPEMAAGGLWSTASDVARFVVAINTAQATGKPGFMRRATAQRMLAPIKSDWSLGFNVDSVGGWRRVSHTGSNNGYRSIFVDFPDRGDAIVILTNGDNGGDLRDEILRSAAALYGWPGYEPMHLTPQPVHASALAPYQGTYRYSGGFASTIAVEGDSLVARLNGGAPGVMYFEGRDAFFSIAGTRYAFERSGDGAITSVKVTFPNLGQLTGRRVTP
jgi:CubicO group peptidase (beta-lactamase class C family)